MSFAPSPTRAAATGFTLAGRGGHAVRRPGLQGDPRWVCDLSPAMLRHAAVSTAIERPSISVCATRSCKVAPEELDAALRAWFSAHGHDDASLAETMKGAVDEAGHCGHETAIAWHQKKPRLRQAHQRDRGRDPVARTNCEETVTADALLTQTAIVRKHDAHYMFVAKDNRRLCSTTSGYGSTTTQNALPTLPTDRQAHQRQAADRARTLGTARNLDHHRASTTISCSPASGRPSSLHPLPSAAGSPTPRSWGVTSHTPHTACPKAAAHQPRPRPSKTPASHPR